MIGDVGLSDQGNYTCQINTHPIKSVIVTLKVEGMKESARVKDH